MRSSGSVPAPNQRRLGLAFVAFLTGVYLLFAPGRILFPDDEIVFQTTAALYEHGSLAIEGIPKRTGEPKGRPDGTFGWAEGTDGRRYGFFGHGLSVVALPAHAVGKVMAAIAPEPWRHALRSDHYIYHRRSQEADWTRLCVSLTNCLITAMAAWMLVTWLQWLGVGWRAAFLTGLAYALGTSAWPYSGTLLSEPLSALVLLGTAACITRYHREREQSPTAWRWAWAAGALAGASAHVHLLNLLALPVLLWAGLVPRRDLSGERRAIVGAMAMGALGLALLGLDHWARFGSPFETGRYDHYGHLIAPWEGLLAFAVAPGRSFFLYSPAIVLGIFGWRAARRRFPRALSLCVAIILIRWTFVATRSDWWGGWGIGPRYLVAVIPFGLLPLAAALDRWSELTSVSRRVLTIGLVGSALAMSHLAGYSIFEHMQGLSREGTVEGVDYFTRSHWYPGASPYLGFARLPEVDMLSVGAVRLWSHGHAGMALLFGAIAAGTLGAGLALVRKLASRP